MKPEHSDQGISRSVVVRAAGDPGDRSSHAHSAQRTSNDDGSTQARIPRGSRARWQRGREGRGSSTNRCGRRQASAALKPTRARPPSRQITLLLSLSVSLLLLPWAARHPTFLFGLPLLAVTPVVGQGVRPLLREALTSLLKALRVSSGWLLPHDDATAQHSHHAHHQHHRRPARDPRTVRSADSHPLVEPSGPYSEWRPPLEWRASNSGSMSGGGSSAAGLPVEPSGPYSEWRPPLERRASNSGGINSGGSSAAGPLVEPSGPYSEWRPPAERRPSSGGLALPGAASSSGSPASSMSGGFSDRGPPPPQQQQQQQQQPHAQQHHRPHHAPVDPRDNLDYLEEEEEAAWAAAAASLAQGGAPYGPRGSSGGDGNGSVAIAGSSAASWDDSDVAAAAAAVDGASVQAQLHAWQTRDPRVLSREEKVQRLSQQLQQEQPRQS